MLKKISSPNLLFHNRRLVTTSSVSEVSEGMTKGTSLGFGHMWLRFGTSQFTPIHSNSLNVVFFLFCFFAAWSPKDPRILIFYFKLFNMQNQKAKMRTMYFLFYFLFFTENTIWKAQRTTRKWLRSYFRPNRGCSLVLGCSASPASQNEAGRVPLCYPEHICGRSTKSGDVIQWKEKKQEIREIFFLSCECLASF